MLITTGSVQVRYLAVGSCRRAENDQRRRETKSQAHERVRRGIQLPLGVFRRGMEEHLKCDGRDCNSAGKGEHGSVGDQGGSIPVVLGKFGANRIVGDHEEGNHHPNPDCKNGQPCSQADTLQPRRRGKEKIKAQPEGNS